MTYSLAIYVVVISEFHNITFDFISSISWISKEMQKFLGTIFFVWDDDLYCPVADERALCNTSDLNEELGQVCDYFPVTNAESRNIVTYFIF